MTNWMKKILATLCALALLLSCAAADSPEIPDIEAEDLELTQDEIAEPDNSQEEQNDDDESEIIVSEVKSLSDEIEQAEGKQEEEQKEEPQEEDSAEDTVPADEAGKPEEPDEIILNLNGRKTIRGSASQTNPYIVKATDDYSRTVFFTLTVPTENSISVTLNDKTLTLTKADTEESIQYTFTCRLKKDEATSLFLTAREGTVSFTLTISKLEITEEPAEETKEEAEEITEEPKEEPTEEDIEQQNEELAEEPIGETEEEHEEEPAEEPTEKSEEEPIGETEEGSEETGDSEEESVVELEEESGEENKEVSIEGLSAKLTVSWENGTPELNTIAHFGADLEGFDGINYTLQLQQSIDGVEWENVIGKVNDEMDVLITEENYKYHWRVKVYIEK